MSEKSSSTNQILSLFCISILLLSVASYFPNSIPDAEGLIADKRGLKIATWNTLDFGGKLGGIAKINDITTLQAMTDVIKQYDIIFVQEIANSTGGIPDAEKSFDGFDNLCGPTYLGAYNYLCQDTGILDYNNKEGYGVIYKNNINLSQVTVELTHESSTSPHIQRGSVTDKMKRPPMKATLQFENDQIVVYNVHTSPSGGVAKEIKLLSEKISPVHNPLSKNNIIVLGDLNAEGNYYPGGFPAHLADFAASNWQQTVVEDDTTNFASSVDAAYDRIILSKALVNSYADYDIVSNTTSTSSFNPSMYPPNESFNRVHVGGGISGKMLSDHQLVWAEFNFGGIEPTDHNANYKNGFMDYVDPPTCDNPDTAYARGEGFVPNSDLHIYITAHPGNNINSAFKNAGQSYHLADVRDIYTTVRSDGVGNIANTPIWNTMWPGEYNIIVDVDRDGQFTNGIDIVDVYNDAGFTVFECERNDNKKRKVGVTDAQRDFITKPDGKKPKIDGSGLSPNTSSTVHIVNSNSVFANNLSGSSVFSSGVSINSQGNFANLITWSNPIKGEYNIILDTNNDNRYDPSTDVIDYADQVGFIVINSRTSHNDIVHLGDNGLEREVYNTGIAQNIYTLAKNLPANSNVDVYVISDKLLKQNISDWGTWGSAYDVDLMDNATPVYEFGEREITLVTSPEGTLFFSQWNDPNQIFDQHFINYYGKKFNTVIDVNQNGMFEPHQTNPTCHGRCLLETGSDFVDTHNIEDMRQWFATHDTLDSSVNNNPAVSEYKEYLNDKLDLEDQLDSTNTYDVATQKASGQYLCSSNLTGELFKSIEAGSQVGFRVLDADEYYADRDVFTGRHVYDSVEFDNLDIKDGSVSVIVSHNGTITASDVMVGDNSNLFICNADVVRIDDFVTSADSTTQINVDHLAILGDTKIHNDSTICLLAAETTALGAGAATFALVDPEPFSKTAFTIFAGTLTLANLLIGSACTL